jgi:hypothetical protein
MGQSEEDQEDREGIQEGCSVARAERVGVATFIRDRSGEGCTFQCSPLFESSYSRDLFGGVLRL